MFVLNEVMQLLGIYGKAIRVVGTGKMNSSHIGEERVGICPFHAVAKMVVSCEYLRKPHLALVFDGENPSHLHASPSARKLSKGKAEKEIRAENTDHRETDFVVESVVPSVLGRPNVWICRDPTTQDNCNAGRPHNVNGSSVFAGWLPTIYMLGTGGYGIVLERRGQVACHC